MKRFMEKNNYKKWIYKFQILSLLILLAACETPVNNHNSVGSIGDIITPDPRDKIDSPLYNQKWLQQKIALFTP